MAKKKIIKTAKPKKTSTKKKLKGFWN